MFGYPKMKGQLEDGVKALDFDHVIVLRPGLIVGERASYDSRAAEYVLRKTAELAGSVSNKAKDFWAQDAEVIARAAVRAGLDCVEGKEREKFRILGQAGKSSHVRPTSNPVLTFCPRYRKAREDGMG